jgi:trehalose 6-phosphate phosphatase
MSVDDIQNAAKAIQTKAHGRHLLLLSDFDGTLCEFSTDPDAVRLTDDRRHLLESLASGPGTTLAIVSGRRLHDVRHRVALDVPAYYAGLHGLEIEGGGDVFRHPDIAATVDLLRQLRLGLTSAFSGLEGVFVEDKELAIVAHFRAASPEVAMHAREIVANLVQPHVASGELRVMRGACVLELLPNLGWDKGCAVTWICQHVSSEHGDVSPVYIGDDVTDEDGFHAVRGCGVAISAATRASGAEFFLDGPTEVRALLEQLIASDELSIAGR